MSLSLACARGYMVKKITKVSVWHPDSVHMGAREADLYKVCSASFFFFPSRYGQLGFGVGKNAATEPRNGGTHENGTLVSRRYDGGWSF